MKTNKNDPPLPVIKETKDLSKVLQEAAIKQSWPEWWPE